MIKATCLCGSTFESDTGYYKDDQENSCAWLILHQNCVNVKNVLAEHRAKQAGNFPRQCDLCGVTGGEHDVTCQYHTE